MSAPPLPLSWLSWDASPRARLLAASCCLVARGQVRQEAAERGPPSTSACATGPTCCLLALRASKPSSSQGSPPSDKSVATCTYMPHRWMDAASHQKRQWSARADIRSYLRSASSREHARILGFDGLQHAGRRKTNKQQARRRLESRAWWTLFLEARRRSRGRPKRARQG